MRYYKGLAALLALTLSFPTMLEIQTKAAEESETAPIGSPAPNPFARVITLGRTS